MRMAEEELGADAAVDAILAKNFTPEQKEQFKRGRFDAEAPTTKGARVVQPEEVEASGEDEDSGIPAEDVEQEEATDGEPEAEGEEAAEQMILINGKKMTSQEFDQQYIPKPEWTKKTMALANERKAVAQATAERLGKLDALIGKLQGEEPNWTELAKTKDPWEYQQLQAEWASRKTELSQALELRNQEQARIHQEATAAMINDLMSGGYEPTWSTEEGLISGLNKLSQFASSTYGVSVQELQQMPDPRVFRILEDARKYREGTKVIKAAKAAVEKAPKVMAPGSKQTVSRAKDSSVSKIEKRFRQTGKPQDLVNFLTRKYKV